MKFEIKDKAIWTIAELMVYAMFIYLFFISILKNNGDNNVERDHIPHRGGAYHARQSGGASGEDGEGLCFAQQLRPADLRRNQHVGESLVAGFAKLLPQPDCVIGVLQVSDG